MSVRGIYEQIIGTIVKYRDTGFWFQLEEPEYYDASLHEKIVDYFGPYCGYAQQFLFKMERENYEKKWL